MCLLSSLDEIDICVKVLTDDVWEDEDNKTGFLSVGVDTFNILFLQKWPMPLPMVQGSNKNRKYG